MVRPNAMCVNEYVFVDVIVRNNLFRTEKELKFNWPNECTCFLYVFVTWNATHWLEYVVYQLIFIWYAIQNLNNIECPRCVEYRLCRRISLDRQSHTHNVRFDTLSFSPSFCSVYPSMFHWIHYSLCMVTLSKCLLCISMSMIIKYADSHEPVLLDIRSVLNGFCHTNNALRWIITDSTILSFLWML